MDSRIRRDRMYGSTRRFDMNIYACSDIHGQYGLFQKMLEDIRFSDHDLLYIIGDIIDRGPDSIPMLQDIMKRDNIICAIGNHELMMYTQYMYPDKESYWLLSNNGGSVTRSAFIKLPPAEQKEILTYIGNMALQIYINIDETHFLLSHSDFVAGKNSLLFRDVPYATAFDTVWNSPWRTWEHVPKSKYKKDGRLHVIGHVPVQYISENPDPLQAFLDIDHNIINIDLGCAGIRFSTAAKTGRALCCMNLTRYAAGDGKASFTYYQ